MMMKELRLACVGEVFDYGMLMSLLHDYKAPHRKITTLLQHGEIIRVKKGLYVFGEEYRRETLNLGVIANLVFGPSYISKEYALSWYGMIPERVDTVTSMTTKRNKSFQTPLGSFTYSYINLHRYTVGIEWQEINQEQHFLIASKEKALIDTVADIRGINNTDEMLEYVIDSLRIDQDTLHELDLMNLTKITQAYRHPMIDLLLKTLKKEVSKWKK